MIAIFGESDFICLFERKQTFFRQNEKSYQQVCDLKNALFVSPFAFENFCTVYFVTYWYSNTKFLSYFRAHYKYSEIKSFLDLRWNQPGNTVYEQLGFSIREILPPDYSYVIGQKRVHKFNCRKQTLSKKYNLPLNMTEKEMCDELGFYRIWNCGLAKYVYR